VVLPAWVPAESAEVPGGDDGPLVGLTHDDLDAELEAMRFKMPMDSEVTVTVRLGPSGRLATVNASMIITVLDREAWLSA